MSKHFSFRRFGLLFKKHFMEQYKTYLMSFVVLAGALFLIMGVLAYLQQEPLSTDAQSFLYMLPLLFAGAISTSDAFSALGDKKRAIASLTLPASHLEKYLLGWLFSYVIFIVLYTICFYIVLSVILSLNNANGQEVQVMNIFSGNFFMNMLGAYAGVHAVAILGSIYFEKGHFIKTAFVFCISLLTLVFINEQVMELVINHEIKASLFNKLTILEGDTKYTIAGPSAYDGLIGTWISLALVLLLWAAAYARLKEKQV